MNRIKITDLAKEHGVSRDTIRRIIMDQEKAGQPIAYRLNKRGQWIIDKDKFDELIKELKTVVTKEQKVKNALLGNGILAEETEKIITILSNIKII